MMIVLYQQTYLESGSSTTGTATELLISRESSRRTQLIRQVKDPTTRKITASDDTANDLSIQFMELEVPAEVAEITCRRSALAMSTRCYTIPASRPELYTS